MIHAEVTPEITFNNYNDALSFFNSKSYSDTVVKVCDCSLEYDGFKVGSEKFPMVDTFIDALFGITKLPRANEKVLPTENVVNDINTIFQSGSSDSEYLIRLVDGKASTLFPIKENVIKRPLNHQEYLDSVLQSVDANDIQNIQLSKKFLRVSTYDKEAIHEVAVGDPHHFGVDFVNGETYRGYPLTAAAMIYRLVCSNGAVAPFENKMVKFKVAGDTDALKKRFIEIASGLTIDNDLMVSRLRNIINIQLTENLVGYISSATKFLPLHAREQIFGGFYEQDIKGNLTESIKPNSCSGLTLYDLYNRITLEAHSNPNIGPLHRYKAEVFAGTLLNENNKEIQKLIV